ncbi:hypothetical protein ANN_12492 [Periplaneta americana]|uniref:Uncharacterized protein n=1 Tax=Periplaneta americana TaxID=6978 RepID=A0ABQ8TIN4_PERAM|nr:hypothetical protein ANN_12492 [Periplaneta americana]
MYFTFLNVKGCAVAEKESVVCSNIKLQTWLVLPAQFAFTESRTPDLQRRCENTCPPTAVHCTRIQACLDTSRTGQLASLTNCPNLPVRKNFFPPRPRRRRKKRRSSNHKQSASLVKSLSTASTVSISDDTQENVGLKGEIDIAGPSNSRLDSGLGSSQESVSKSETDSQGVSSLSGVSSASSSDCNDMCITCMINPKNGIFVHGKVGHICCCYKCALRVWAVTGKCPLYEYGVRGHKMPQCQDTKPELASTQPILKILLNTCELCSIKVSGISFDTLNEIWAVLQEEWNIISQETLQVLVVSMTSLPGVVAPNIRTK